MYFSCTYVVLIMYHVLVYSGLWIKNEWSVSVSKRQMCNEHKKWDSMLTFQNKIKSLCNRPVRRKRSLLTKFIFSQSLYTSMHHQRTYEDVESTKVYTSNVRNFQNFVECKGLQFCNIIPIFIWWLDVWVLNIRYWKVKVYKMTCKAFSSHHWTNVLIMDLYHI